MGPRDPEGARALAARSAREAPGAGLRRRGVGPSQGALPQGHHRTGDARRRQGPAAAPRRAEGPPDGAERDRGPPSAAARRGGGPALRPGAGRPARPRRPGLGARPDRARAPARAGTHGDARPREGEGRPLRDGAREAEEPRTGARPSRAPLREDPRGPRRASPRGHAGNGLGRRGGPLRREDPYGPRLRARGGAGRGREKAARRARPLRGRRERDRRGPGRRRDRALPDARRGAGPPAAGRNAGRRLPRGGHRAPARSRGRAAAGLASRLHVERRPGALRRGAERGPRGDARSRAPQRGTRPGEGRGTRLGEPRGPRRVPRGRRPRREPVLLDRVQGGAVGRPRRAPRVLPAAGLGGARRELGRERRALLRGTGRDGRIPPAPPPLLEAGRRSDRSGPREDRDPGGRGGPDDADLAALEHWHRFARRGGGDRPRAPGERRAILGDGRVVVPAGEPRYRGVLDHLGGLAPGETKPVPPWSDGS